MSYQLLLTTCPDEESADSLSRALVERRLAACVTRLPGAHSTYIWKGEVCQGQELVLLIKSRAERYPELERTLLELHPYELPEIVAVPIDNGLAPYLAWIDEQTETIS